MSNLRLHYHNSINFGDYLSKAIAEFITGKNVIRVDERVEADHFSFIGSVLGNVNDKTTVIGSGIGSFNQPIPDCKEFVAVRGEYSRKRVLAKGRKCNHIFDPAVLAPMFYDKPAPGPFADRRDERIAVVPHYVDYYAAMTKYRDDAVVVDLLRTPEEVISQIALSDFVISSSLHGIIIAHAYGKPAMWVEFTDNLAGDGIKFWDYFSFAGIQPYEPLDLKGKPVDIDKIKKQIPEMVPEFDTDGILQIVKDGFSKQG